jgi:hypothetical protein
MHGMKLLIIPWQSFLITISWIRSSFMRNGVLYGMSRMNRKIIWRKFSFKKTFSAIILNDYD